jgi:hypothetical protein
MKNVQGLRLFLITLLELSSKGEKETCSYVENAIGKGVATELCKKYQEFYQNGLQVNSVKLVDDYYRQWNRCADGQENKYMCGENDGLLLLIALALNEFN